MVRDFPPNPASHIQIPQRFSLPYIFSLCQNCDGGMHARATIVPLTIIIIISSCFFINTGLTVTRFPYFFLLQPRLPSSSSTWSRRWRPRPRARPRRRWWAADRRQPQPRVSLRIVILTQSKWHSKTSSVI